MSHPTLSRLLDRGISRSRFRFGPGADAIAAPECARTGLRLFDDGSYPRSVAAVLTNDRPTVELLLGAIASGCRVVSLPMPSHALGLDDYATFVKNVLALEGLHELVVSDRMGKQLDGLGLGLRRHSELAASPLACPSGRFELVQFSSGSTDRPKAILLTDEQLGANVAATVAVVSLRGGDGTVSWLPLSHDMGLIGMLFGPLASAGEVARDVDIAILDPSDALRRPAMWLTACTELRAAVTTAPDFGYRLLCDRPPKSAFDLSALRFAIVGGETVRASTLIAVEELLGPAGLTRTALCPAYGLAEIGLAATITPEAEPWRSIDVLTEPLGIRRLVGSDRGRTRDAVTSLVAAGPPLEGYTIRCDAAPREVGSVLVRGPSIGSDRFTGAPLAEPEGWLETGDLGTIVDGWLYLSGRSDDHIVTAARNIYAPAVEAAAGAVRGVRAGRAAALGLPSGEWVVVAEISVAKTLTTTSAASLKREIRAAVVATVGAAPSSITLIRRAGLPVTPSGKLQRHEAIRRYLAGEFGELA